MSKIHSKGADENGVKSAAGNEMNIYSNESLPI
jgi:hypothetical protein